jgi:hypothetical protein
MVFEFIELELEPELWLTCQLLPNLPKTVDPATITLSNAPSGGDSKKLQEIARFKIGQIGLRYEPREGNASIID